jgi:RimJ/RimL family protein N-acetyltransferase
MKAFQTARLTIRGFRPDDWRDLQEYVSQKDVTKYDYEYPSSDEECKGLAEYFSRGSGFWAVCLKDAGKMIGHIVINQKEPKEFSTWHIGFVFNPTYHGKGYATESCKRILKYVFEELGAHRVESACHPDNTPAWKLLERLSMRREAHHKKSGFVRKTLDGKPIWWDSYLYAILEEEWMERTGSSNDNISV